MSDDENEALWRLFGAQEASIAIRTTYDQLLDVLRGADGVFLGLITYVDYDKDKGRMRSDLDRVMHKRVPSGTRTKCASSGCSMARSGGVPHPLACTCP